MTSVSRTPKEDIECAPARAYTHARATSFGVSSSGKNFHSWRARKRGLTGGHLRWLKPQGPLAATSLLDCTALAPHSLVGEVSRLRVSLARTHRTGLPYPFSFVRSGKVSPRAFALDEAPSGSGRLHRPDRLVADAGASLRLVLASPGSFAALMTRTLAAARREGWSAGIHRLGARRQSPRKRAPLPFLIEKVEQGEGTKRSWRSNLGLDLQHQVPSQTLDLRKNGGSPVRFLRSGAVPRRVPRGSALPQKVGRNAYSPLLKGAPKGSTAVPGNSPSRPNAPQPYLGHSLPVAVIPQGRARKYG